MALVLLPVLLIATQPDLGTSVIIGASGVFVIFFAGLLWRYLIAAAILGAAGLPLVLSVMREYHKQ